MTPVNDDPVTGDDSMTVDEDGSVTADVRTNDNAGPNEGGQTLTASIYSAPAHGTAEMVGDSIKYTPASDYLGPDQFFYTLCDDGPRTSASTPARSPSRSTRSTTRRPARTAPSPSSRTGATPSRAADFGFSDPEGDTFKNVHITGDPTNGALTLSGNPISAPVIVAANSLSLLVFTPAANANGDGYATFEFTVQDDGGTLNGGVDTDPTANTITIDVTPVNDAPSFTKGLNEQVNEDSGAHSTSLWATAISAGPSDESLQALDFIVEQRQPRPVQRPAGGFRRGTLTYTVAPDAHGLANLTVSLHDDGLGADTSAPQTFTINILSVNDAPSGTNGTIAVLEDGSHTFAPADFGFSDPEGGTFKNVHITGDPTNGTLTLSGNPIYRSGDRGREQPRRSSSSPRRRTPTATTTPHSSSRSRTTAARSTAASTPTRPRTRSPST